MKKRFSFSSLYFYLLITFSTLFSPQCINASTFSSLKTALISLFIIVDFANLRVQSRKAYFNIFDGPDHKNIQGITPDNSGGAYLVGQREYNSTPAQSFLTHYDDEGLPEWSVEMGESHETILSKVAKGHFGDSIAVCGTIGNTTLSNIIISSYQLNGNILWIRYLGIHHIERCNDFIANNDGGYALVGSTVDGDKKALVAKTNFLGDLSWMSIAESGADFTPTGITETPDGDIVIIGDHYLSNSATHDIIVVMLDDFDGSILWKKIIQKDGDDQSQGIGASLDNGVVFISNSVNGTMSTCMYGKVSEIGELEFFKSFNDAIPAYCSAKSIAFNNNGEFTISGQFYNQDDDTIVFTTRFNSDGNIISTKSIGSNSVNIPTDHSADNSNGEFFIVGNTNLNTGNPAVYNGFVAKLKSDELAEDCSSASNFISRDISNTIVFSEATDFIVNIQFAQAIYTFVTQNQVTYTQSTECEVTSAPTRVTSTPTAETAEPTLEPTLRPSNSPTIPTVVPTAQPSLSPSENPSVSPSENPSVSPSENPSVSPTYNPTDEPTATTVVPTGSPVDQGAFNNGGASQMNIIECIKGFGKDPEKCFASPEVVAIVIGVPSLCVISSLWFLLYPCIKKCCSKKGDSDDELQLSKVVGKQKEETTTNNDNTTFKE